jgi:hypothetical protein
MAESSSLSCGFAWPGPCPEPSGFVISLLHRKAKPGQAYPLYPPYFHFASILRFYFHLSNDPLDSDFMPKKKVTPEIERFIQDNHTLNSTALSGIIEKKFGLKITYRAIDPYLDKARSDAELANAAKVEAVRSQILDDADRWANNYLKYLDEEVDALRALKESGKLTFGKDGETRTIEIKDIKDRMAVSQTLHKHLITVIEFVKPGNDATLPDEDLDAKLERLISKRKA